MVFHLCTSSREAGCFVGKAARDIVPSEELIRLVYEMIDRCFASGMELDEILAEVEEYIASLEK
jgi:hypothetical protein